MMGTGKESDIYLCLDADGNEAIIKLARLGRMSFRTIKTNRDYLKGRPISNWLYVSRIAAEKEFIYMKALYEQGFPTPVPIQQNRHAIVMSLIPGHPLNQVRVIVDPTKVFNQCFDLI
jgi:RIO kinase 2